MDIGASFTGNSEVNFRETLVYRGGKTGESMVIAATVKYVLRTVSETIKDSVENITEICSPSINETAIN